MRSIPWFVSRLPGLTALRRLRVKTGDFDWKPGPTYFAWALVFLISDLPEVTWNELVGAPPTWLFWAKVSLLVIGLLACLLWKSIRPLWQFSFVFAVFYLALAASAWIGNTSFWQAYFGGENVSFTAGYLGFHIRDMGIAFLVIIALWIVKRDRQAFFLAKGQLDAPIEPVGWLGIHKGESWSRFGWIFAASAGLGILIPILLNISIPLSALLSTASLVPVAIIFAALNAFAEEVYFRASLLSTLRGVIGNNQALLLNMVFFGLAHVLYGSPPGILGFVLTGFLAFLLGKSMLETKGIFWAWFIHFVPDTLIFISYALTWVQR